MAMSVPAAPAAPAIPTGPGRRPSREARLRPEFAGLYPGLRSGEWAAAATLADRVLAGWLMRGSVAAVRGRMLPESHFEFRGGGVAGGERTGVRLGAEIAAAIVAQQPFRGSGARRNI